MYCEIPQPCISSIESALSTIMSIADCLPSSLSANRPSCRYLQGEDNGSHFRGQDKFPAPSYGPRRRGRRRNQRRCLPSPLPLVFVHERPRFGGASLATGKPPAMPPTTTSMNTRATLLLAVAINAAPVARLLEIGRAHA